MECSAQECECRCVACASRVCTDNPASCACRLQVRCPGRCCEEWYCSARCAEAAWEQYHQLLCVGPEADDAAQGEPLGAPAGKGKAAVTEGVTGSGSSGEGGAELAARREALREFLHHADSTNDVFRLAAIVVARTLLAAQRQLEAEPSAAAAAGSSSVSSAGGEPSAEACWQALLTAWRPFAVGHKGLWWECTAAPPEAAAGAPSSVPRMHAPAICCNCQPACKPALPGSACACDGPPTPALPCMMQRSRHSCILQQCERK